MKQKFVITLLLLIFSLNSITAFQSQGIKPIEEEEIPTRFLGVSASLVSGMGLSYHFIASNRNMSPALKITFGAVPDINSHYDIWDMIWIFAGVDLQMTIGLNDSKRIYWFLSAGYMTLYASAGAGVGIEVYSGINGIAFNFDLGVGVYDEGVYYNNGIGNDFSFIPAIGFGLSYTME